MAGAFVDLRLSVPGAKYDCLAFSDQRRCELALRRSSCG